jgi:PleD family two-component response regulator
VSSYDVGRFRGIVASRIDATFSPDTTTIRKPGDLMLIQFSTARFLASQATRPRLLIVEDESMICDLLGLLLEEDYQVTCVGTSEDALRVLAEQIIDVMLLDYHLPRGGAVEVARRVDEAGIPMA